MFSLKLGGMSRNCVLLFCASRFCDTTCSGDLLFMTVVVTFTECKKSMKVWLQFPPSLFTTNNVACAACSRAVCVAYPITKPRMGNIMSGTITIPMRIFGSRISSLSSLTRMVWKPLSITEHLCEYFFKVGAVKFDFELLGLSFNHDLAFVEQTHTVAKVFHFKHVMATEQDFYA